MIPFKIDFTEEVVLRTQFTAVHVANRCEWKAQALGYWIFNLLLLRYKRTSRPHPLQTSAIGLYLR